ncbi:MAG: hypothetical protein OWU84_08885 [Firmicutes bacterium]|nr:hypothetical protein [Bacillota bacterium]
MRKTWQKMLALLSLLAGLVALGVPSSVAAQSLPQHQAAVSVKSAAHAKKTDTKKTDTKKTTTKKTTTKKTTTKKKVTTKAKSKATKKTVKSKAKKSKKS